MKHSIRLDIPESVPSLNKLLRMHWGQRYAINKQWAWLIRAAILERRVIRVTFEKAHVTIERYDHRRLDRDNMVGGAKETILDCLKKEGFIIDDDEDHVITEYVQHIGEPHTTISLEAA